MRGVVWCGVVWCGVDASTAAPGMVKLRIRAAYQLHCLSFRSRRRQLSHHGKEKAESAYILEDYGTLTQLFII